MRFRRQHTTFQRMVLGVINDISPNAYGVPIWEEVERRLGRGVALSKIYWTLESLERRGCVTSRLGDATPERGNRAKCYFQLTEVGSAVLREQQ